MSHLRIASPCAADWNAMRPVDGGRHCTLCARNVVDLNCLAPSAREAEIARLSARGQAGERICISAPSTRDGHVLSSSRRILTGGMAAMLAMAMAGCQGEDIAQNNGESPNPGHGDSPAIIAPEVHSQMRGEATVRTPAVMGIIAIAPPPAKEASPSPTPEAPHAAQ
jgi:hypothetical protein